MLQSDPKLASGDSMEMEADGMIVAYFEYDFSRSGAE